MDIRRARRINHHDPGARSSAPIQRIAPAGSAGDFPSERLDAIAARHVGDLPHAVRTMLGGVGVSSRAADIKGSALASYLLFEKGYTNELMDLGYADAAPARRGVQVLWLVRSRARPAKQPEPAPSDARTRCVCGEISA